MELLLLLLVVIAPNAAGAGTLERGPLTFASLPEARFQIAGPVGERLRANTEHWLLSVPRANPGMLEMFRVRDRKPVPQLVPWAGEFVGKYLVSGIQALRLDGDPRLFRTLSNTVGSLLATQAEDGYLGPFPKEIRLLRNWDLWGHFHAIQALLLWHEHTGAAAALGGARRAADLVCDTYLDTGRRVFDAGDHEMNMAILTALVQLHRVTGEPRYWRMAREVERDWERAGDYLRAGLDGREFYQSPRPRWESLHDLQGLLELWRVTGEERYREAFVRHWRSIRRWDRRNTGGFSSGEQATGNPFAPTAIETCCTVAWMALTLDYLRLTGDLRAADELELSTLNGGLGAQHPSGRWWTYNTPMDGAREASAHTIVFQARAGTPELNCCSVNGPRVLGMLSDWAILEGADVLVLNWLGPVEIRDLVHQGRRLRVRVSGSYPVQMPVRIEVQSEDAAEISLALRVRVPAWMTGARYRIQARVDPSEGPARAGEYLEVRRVWRAGDGLALTADLPVRAVAGANEVAGRVSLYRGPLLLAYDQRDHDFDEADLPPVALARLSEAALEAPPANEHAFAEGLPLARILVPTLDPARPLRLVDFASAGAAGTRYRSWLPAMAASTEAPARGPGPGTPVDAKPGLLSLPEPAFTRLPPDGARVRPGPAWFRWRGPRLATRRPGETSASNPAAHYRVEFATNPAFEPVKWTTRSVSNRVSIDLRQPGFPVRPGERVFWRVAHVRGPWTTVPDVPAAQFILDPDAPATIAPHESQAGPDGERILHSLRDSRPPEFGEIEPGPVSGQDRGGTTLNGQNQRILYRLDPWPEEDFTVAVRARLRELPRGRLGQVFSAWAGPMDDPLRLVVDQGRLYARVEAGSGYSTAGAPVSPGRWLEIVAIRRAGHLALYLDGQPVGTCFVPEGLPTQSAAVALGGNPRYSGSEFLSGTFADFVFLERAWSDDELRQWTQAAPNP